MADHSHVLHAAQRKNAVIFEQDHAFSGDLAREGVVRIHVKFAAFRGLRRFKDNPQNPAHGFIQHRFIQLAERTASITAWRRCSRGPGISRSSPASREATRSCTAPQSDTTNPSKPHSVFKNRP